MRRRRIIIERIDPIVSESVVPARNYLSVPGRDCSSTDPCEEREQRAAEERQAVREQLAALREEKDREIAYLRGQLNAYASIPLPRANDVASAWGGGKPARPTVFVFGAPPSSSLSEVRVPELSYPLRAELFPPAIEGSGGGDKARAFPVSDFGGDVSTFTIGVAPPPQSHHRRRPRKAHAKAVKNYR